VRWNPNGIFHNEIQNDFASPLRTVEEEEEEEEEIKINGEIFQDGIPSTHFFVRTREEY